MEEDKKKQIATFRFGVKELWIVVCKQALAHVRIVLAQVLLHKSTQTVPVVVVPARIEQVRH